MTSQGLHNEHEGLFCLFEYQQQNEESGIDELEVSIRSALPYQDEPLAQVAALYTDEDENYGLRRYRR